MQFISFFNYFFRRLNATWILRFSLALCAHRSVICIIVLMIAWEASFAQTLDYPYTIYDKSDGLPSNTVYDMVNDQEGMMWIGTDAGLCKFDGIHFKIFTTDDGLPSNDIFKLYCDSKNRIWVLGMSSNIAYVKEEKVYNKSNDSLLARINIGNGYNQLFLQKNKAIRIVSSLYVYDIDSNNHLQINQLNRPAKKKPIYLAIPDHDGLLILGADSIQQYNSNEVAIPKLNKPSIVAFIIGEFRNHFYYVERLKNYYSPTTIEAIKANTFSIRNTNIRPLLHNHLNQLLLIENNGILVYELNNLRKPVKKFVPDFPLLNYYQDTSHRNWFATRGNGLITTNSEHHRIFRSNSGLNVNKFHSLTLTPGSIVLGDNKGQVMIVDRKTFRVQKVLDFNQYSKSSIRIQKISVYKSDLIISTDYGCYRYKSGAHKESVLIEDGADKSHVILHDSLFSLENSGVRIFSLKTRNLTQHLLKRIYSFCEYKGQRVVGSETGLYLFDGDSFSPYTLNQPFEYRIMDMYVKDSVLVLVTVNDGVFFVKDHTILKSVSIKNGLSTNNCFKALPYQQKVIIATSNGINMYDTKTDSVQVIFECDGLASNAVNDILIEHDTLYAATENGLSIIAFKDIEAPKPFKLFYKPVIVDKDTLWNTEAAIVSRTDKPLMVVLNSLSYGVKGKVTYYFRYKDSVYTSTTDPKIPLIFSSPGKYNFEAYAVDNNKRQSNHLSLQIEIKPYIWQTWYFVFFMILLGITLLVFVAYIVDKSTTKRESQKRLNDQKLYQLELEAWQSKFNPHFLFNSLSSISSLIQTHRSEKAVLFIQNFSFILRRTIQNSSKLLNKIEEEVHYIENYLNLELIKRNDLFTYSITFSSETIRSYYIPSLLIQPVIENSLKHGIRSNENGHIFIHFELMEHSIQVTLSDNGKIQQKSEDQTSQHRSMGMKLIEDKIQFMEKLLKQKIGFSSNIYNATEQEGAVTIFIFPLITRDL